MLVQSSAFQKQSSHRVKQLHGKQGCLLETHICFAILVSLKHLQEMNNNTHFWMLGRICRRTCTGSKTFCFTQSGLQRLFCRLPGLSVGFCRPLHALNLAQKWPCCVRQLPRQLFMPGFCLLVAPLHFCQLPLQHLLPAGSYSCSNITLVRPKIKGMKLSAF